MLDSKRSASNAWSACRCCAVDRAHVWLAASPRGEDVAGHSRRWDATPSRAATCGPRAASRNCATSIGRARRGRCRRRAHPAIAEAGELPGGSATRRSTSVTGRPAPQGPSTTADLPGRARRPAHVWRRRPVVGPGPDAVASGRAGVAPETGGLGVVVSAAERDEVGGSGLAGWTGRVVGDDVVEVAASAVDLAAGEAAGRVSEDDVLAHPLGWVVAVDGVVAVHPDHRLDADGGVADPVADLVGGDRAEALGAADFGSGVVVEVGHVEVQVEDCLRRGSRLIARCRSLLDHR